MIGRGVPGAQETCWIERPDQLRCLISTRRADIVDRLAAGGPASVRELAQALGARPAALYHHLRLLQAADLVQVVGHRVANRRRELVYATPARRLQAALALDQPQNVQVMREIVASLTRQMDRDFQTALVHPAAATSGQARNLGFFRLIGRPDESTLAEINGLLTQVAELLWNAQGGRNLVGLNWILAPIPDAAESAAPPGSAS